jgi:hypothetical protein
MSPEHRKAISEGQRNHFRNWTEEQREEWCEKTRDAALIRHARHKLIPESRESRGHRFQEGNIYGIGGGQDIGEGMIIARTIKETAWAVYRQNPQLIYDAIVEGIKAEPPRSVPYLALIMKCEEDIMAKNSSAVSAGWVSYLTPEEHEELRVIMADERLQRIMSRAKARMQGSAERDIVIDLPPAPSSGAGDSNGGGQ